MKDLGILTVKDVYEQLEFYITKRHTLRERCRVKADKLQLIVQQARDAKVGPSALINHRKAANPYLSRFGEAKWEEQVRKSSSMQRIVNIRDLIEHLIKVQLGTDFFAGSPHHSDWVFYHDALSLMTSKETMEWMREKDYLERWFLPELGLNHRIRKG